MAISRALMRLLHLRESEEDQHRFALQSAISRLSFLEDAFERASAQSRRGRQLVQASAETGELVDRIAGLRETSAALSARQHIAQEIETARQKVAILRENFLAARIRHRQIESLIARKANQDAAVSKRKEQQAADDWHRRTSRADRTQEELPLREPENQKH